MEERKFHIDRNRDAMMKLEKDKSHVDKQQQMLKQGSNQINYIKDGLLPTSAEDIDTQAVDLEDKETLEEIMEQNLVLKVLEKELKQQEDIS